MRATISGHIHLFENSGQCKHLSHCLQEHELSLLTGGIYEVSMVEMMLSSTSVPQGSVLAIFLFTVHMIDF